MNSLHRHLLDLLRMAETPVYSAYRWLGRQSGHQLALSAFLQLVQDLLDKDAIQLWTIEADTGEATQLHSLPANLATRDASLDHDDERYDPLCLSLTLGPAAEPDVEPDWEFDLDFQGGTFGLHAAPTEVNHALRQLGRYFPDVTLMPEDTTRNGKRTRIIGQIRTHAAPPSNSERSPS